MKLVTIELFSINELAKECKNKAIQDHKIFMLDTYDNDMFDESFNMTKSKYAKSLTKSEIIEDIEANEYLYFSNGELAPTIQYCGKHIRAGEHVFNFKDKEYLIK